VKKALEGLDGVKSAEVSLKTNSAKVTMKDDSTLDKKVATKAITDAGYGLTSYKDPTVKADAVKKTDAKKDAVKKDAPKKDAPKKDSPKRD
jgi:copper chaperone CopZ